MRTTDAEWVSVDHPCWNCSYNVRGLPVDSQCPECGQPIDLSRFPRKILDHVRRASAYPVSFLILLLMCGTCHLDWAIAVTVDWTGEVNREFVRMVGLISAILALPGWWLTKHRAPLVMFIAITLMLLILPFAPFPPNKPYRRFYTRISNGMTQAQVVQLLDGHFPNRASDGHPIVSRYGNRLQLVLDPTDGRYNAELIHIDFSNDRVVSKEYWPD